MSIRIDIPTEQLQRLIDFLEGEFEDPLRAAVACLSAYIQLCQQHSTAPDLATIAAQAAKIINSHHWRDAEEEERPN